MSFCWLLSKPHLDNESAKKDGQKHAPPDGQLIHWGTVRTVKWTIDRKCRRSRTFSCLWPPGPLWRSGHSVEEQRSKKAIKPCLKQDRSDLSYFLLVPLFLQVLVSVVLCELSFGQSFRHLGAGHVTVTGSNSPLWWCSLYWLDRHR